MIYVHKGPAALREGLYWRGWKSGNVPCAQRRKTYQQALQDAAPQPAEPK